MLLLIDTCLLFHFLLLAFVYLTVVQEKL